MLLIGGNVFFHALHTHMHNHSYTIHKGVVRIVKTKLPGIMVGVILLLYITVLVDRNELVNTLVDAAFFTVALIDINTPDDTVQ